MRKLITALPAGAPDDGDEGRQLRGLAIAALDSDHIRPNKLGYKVPSQSGNGAYLVNLDDGPYCTCEDFEKRRKACKHVYAVETMLQRSDRLDDEPPEAVRLTSRSWAAYNAAQVHEGELFERLLLELVSEVPQPIQTNGRPRLPIADMLYAMGMKVYTGFSTRRAMSGVRDSVAKGRVGREHCFSTTARYFKRPELTPVLRQLVQYSSLPLRDVETVFAIDSSGFASTAYNRWFEHKWGHVEGKKAVRWAKLHIICGVLTNIVTAADATASMSADAPYLPEFVRVTAENFTVREVSGDMAYSSRRNLHAIVDAGGQPYIPFKTGAVARPKSGPADSLWTQMFHYFTLSTAEFNQRYHQRSNVETCFHMMKAKFGDKIRSKTDTAMVNETLMMVVAHNICCVIRAMHTLGITPVFDQAFSTESAPVAEPSRH